jgi:hypothetical protein
VERRELVCHANPSKGTEMKLHQWRQALPKAEQIARKVEQEVQKQIGDMLIQMADQWTSENKLIHAGAARRLAEKLKEKS